MSREGGWEVGIEVLPFVGGLWSAIEGSDAGPVRAGSICSVEGCRGDSTDSIFGGAG